MSVQLIRQLTGIPRYVFLIFGVIGLLALALVPGGAAAQGDSDPLVVSLSAPAAEPGDTVSVKVEGGVCVADTAGSMQVTAGQPQEVVIYEIPFDQDANNTNFVVQEIPADQEGAPLSVVVTCTDADGVARTGSAPFETPAPVNGFTIRKDVSGGTSTQAFTFTVEGSPPVPGPTVHLSDGGSHPAEFGAAQIDTGVYTITESPTPGWQLTEISCDHGSAVGDLTTGRVSFELDDNTWLTCTFVNTMTKTPPKAQPAYTG